MASLSGHRALRQRPAGHRHRPFVSMDPRGTCHPAGYSRVRRPSPLGRPSRLGGLWETEPTHHWRLDMPDSCPPAAPAAREWTRDPGSASQRPGLGPRCLKPTGGVRGRSLQDGLWGGSGPVGAESPMLGQLTAGSCRGPHRTSPGRALGSYPRLQSPRAWLASPPTDPSSCSLFFQQLLFWLQSDKIVVATHNY